VANAASVEVALSLASEDYDFDVEIIKNIMMTDIITKISATRSTILDKLGFITPTLFFKRNLPKIAIINIAITGIARINQFRYPISIRMLVITKTSAITTPKRVNEGFLSLNERKAIMQTIPAISSIPNSHGHSVMVLLLFSSL
jgi:hypothetical protein